MNITLNQLIKGKHETGNTLSDIKEIKSFPNGNTVLTHISGDTFEIPTTLIICIYKEYGE